MWTLILVGAAVLARPPLQSAVQKKVFETWVNASQKLSDAAKPELLKALDDHAFRQDIASLTGINNRTPAELLEMLYQEIHLANIVHNIGAPGRGVPLDKVEAMGYLPTLWDELAEGQVQWQPGMAGLNNIEVKLMHFPDMAMPPKAPQAYDRAVYTGLNIWKQSAGQLNVGPVGIVLDKLFRGADLFYSPIDTGCYALTCGPGAGVKNSSLLGGCDGPCDAWNRKFGSGKHFYHLVMPHLRYWKATLGQLFRRWYGKNEPIRLDQPYFEGEFCATWLIPEAVLYFGIDYAWFGQPNGKSMQTWAIKIHRPIVWADQANTGSMIDATVKGIDGRYQITSADSQNFQNLWNAKPDWNTFKNKTNPNLQLHLLGYLNGKDCDPSKCTNCRFLGVNAKKECLFWRPKNSTMP